MSRGPGTNSSGSSFDQSTVKQVWEKGRLVPDYDKNLWRYDMCGKPIRFTDYGNTSSPYGWEIDHIRPVALNGSDDLNNLQPLQWANNRTKSDNFPWQCR